MLKIPAGRLETSYETMREDPRTSSMRERKLVDERDELVRKLNERNKELDSIKNSAIGNKTDRGRGGIQLREQQG
jgi:hypothetical protein